VETGVSQEKTEAVVLRGVDFSETSRIMTFVTPDRGRLTCIAKGVRRKNSPLASILDTFNRVELVYYWKDGRGVQTLAEASLLDGFPGLKQDLERYSYGAFPLELAYKTVHDNEPSQDFYKCLVDGLKGLEQWTGDAQVHTCKQVLQLLRVAGFSPVLTECVRCGGSLPEAPGFTYSGGVTCVECFSDRRLSAGAFRALQGLDDITPVTERPLWVQEVFQVLLAYAQRQLDSDFRSVRVLEDMFGHQ
jgi:DNA repair protein RecO (recombination protein O)